MARPDNYNLGLVLAEQPWTFISKHCFPGMIILLVRLFRRLEGQVYAISGQLIFTG